MIATDIKKSTSTNFAELSLSTGSNGTASPQITREKERGDREREKEMGGATSSLPLVERLQAMLSQRDAEIAVIQSQLSSLEDARSI